MWQILSLSFAFTGILAWTRTHFKFSNEDASARGEILNISKTVMFSWVKTLCLISFETKTITSENALAWSGP